MIADLQPYPEYKESGLPWLGRYPAHWNLRRTKFLLREIDSRTKTGKEQLLRVSQYTGVTERKASDGSDTPDTRASSLVGYKQVEPNDLVINIMLAWNGSMGISRFKGIASPAYCIYRFRDGCSPWYFHHLFRLPLYKGRIKTASTGVVESRLRLYSDDLGRIEALLPPPDEQAAIVRFLGHANRKIDRFIRAKRKLIGLLNEQKQAIIHHAVTRGLDPNVKLKPSGIPWLGDVPEHWEVQPLKSVCSIQSGITLGKDYLGQLVQEYPYLRVANVQAGHAKLDVVKTIRVTRAEAQRTMLLSGDVLMTEGGDPDKLGRGCVWEAQIANCLHQNHVFAVRPNQKRLSPYFLTTLMRMAYARAYFQMTAKQTTNLAATNKTKIGMFKVLLPTIEEQQRLLGMVDEVTRPLSTTITRTEREIALMQEYRTRLTADVVTGKFDVREAARTLPDDEVGLPVESEAPENFEAEEEIAV